MCYQHLFGSRCYFLSFSFNVQNIVGQVSREKQQADLNWTRHFGLCFRFFILFYFPFFFGATCYMLLFLSTCVREREEKARADSTETGWRGGGKIKHRMMGAVIASQTTERIKNPLPSLACFIASSSSLDGIITLFVLRKRKLAAAIQTTVRPRGSIAPPDMDVLWHSDRDLQSYQEGGDLKQRRTRFLPCPSSFRLWSWRVWRLEGGRCATAACYYHPRIKILFSYIYHKHFIAQLLSLPLGCICHRSDRTKRRPSFLPPHGLQALHGFFFLFPSLLIFRMDL